MHQHVTMTRRSDKSLRMYWRIFVKIFVSATEFCRSDMLQKIKSDRICATCRGDKPLSQRHDAICRCDVSPLLVAATCRLVCIDLKNGDFGAIFVTERSWAAPISQVESHISDRCPYYTGQLFVSERTTICYSINIA